MGALCTFLPFLSFPPQSLSLLSSGSFNFARKKLEGKMEAGREDEEENGKRDERLT